jgi:hypothetical protein
VVNSVDFPYRLEAQGSARVEILEKTCRKSASALAFWKKRGSFRPRRYFRHALIDAASRSPPAVASSAHAIHHPPAPAPPGRASSPFHLPIYDPSR